VRTLSAAVQSRVANRTLAEIPYATLRPVLDHVAGTLADRDVVAVYPIVRLYSSMLASESPMLRDVQFPTQTMSHLPSSIGAGVDTLTRRVRLSLVNPPYREYQSLYDYLTRETRLDGAEVGLDVWNLPPRELTSDPVHADRIDAAVSAGEALRWFRGIVERVIAVGPEIQLECRSELPQLLTKQVPDDGSDPRDRGLRLPLPIGSNAAVRCVNLDVGAISTIAMGLKIDANAIELDDASEFPSTGSAMIGAEKVTWGGKTDNILTGLLRAESGTLAADHVLGTRVFEVQPLTVGIADGTVGSVHDLYILSPTTQSTVEIPKLAYVVNYADETTAPGSAGDPITTVTMNGNQLSALLNALYADATVLQQAEYATEIPPAQASEEIQADNLANILVATNAGAEGDWTAPTGDWATNPPTWSYNKQSADQEGLRCVYGPLGPEPIFGLVLIRWDFTVDVTALSSPMTWGLTANGVEGFVSGVTDGDIVASQEFTSTGIYTVQGTTYAGVEGANLSDLDGMDTLLIKSEIAGGNPTCEIEVTDMRVHYVTEDDTTEVSVAHPVDTNALDGSSFPDHEGTWSTTPPTVPPVFVYDSSGPNAEKWLGSWTSDPDPSIQKIISARFRFTTTRGNANGSFESRCHADFDGPWVANGFLDSVPGTVTNDHGITGGQVTQDVELDVAADAVMADLIGCGFHLFTETTNITTDGDIYTFDEYSIEVTYLIDGSFTPTPRVQDLTIQAAAGGVGLELFALVDGPEIPAGQAGDYPSDALEGDTISHPADVVYYWLRELGGIDAGDIDAATFAKAFVDLPGYVWGFDARNMGATWADILLAMGYESRANIVRDAEGAWKMLTATPDTPVAGQWGFGTPTVTIDSYSDLVIIEKDNSERRTRLTIYYNFDPRFDSGDNRSFVSVQTTDPADPDVVSREEDTGRNDAEPYFLGAHRDTAGVEDWRGYTEQEMGRFARLFTCRVDHWQAAALELGDGVKFIVQPDSAAPETVTCRVIEVQRSQRQGYLCRFVEVL